MKRKVSPSCPGPGWVREDRACEYGKNGGHPCRRRGVIHWNATICPPRGRRRKVLRGPGILVCRQCASVLTSQIDALTLCLAARDGARLARQIWG